MVPSTDHKGTAMETALGMLAFAALVAAQVAAVIALHGRRQRQPAEQVDARFEPLIGLIRNSGG
jgi:Flp pilus assembly protein TadG